MRSEQNLTAAIAAGFAAALLGAAIWAATTIITEYQLGLIAIAIGVLVGYAVRTAGKGIDPVFGVVGGALSLLGCAVGNLVAICGLYASQEGLELFGILTSLSPSAALELMTATFTPMDLIFYGIAVYEGYRFSFRTTQPVVAPAPVVGGK